MMRIIALILAAGMMAASAVTAYADLPARGMMAEKIKAEPAHVEELVLPKRKGTPAQAATRVIRMGETPPASLKAGTKVGEQEIKRNGLDAYFFAEEISDALFTRMYGKSFKENCSTPREDLRYLKVLYCGAGGASYVGEMVCNKEISDALLEIFRELYENQYPIEKMVLVDDYDGDNLKSAADNNTSCFNFRTAEGTSENLSFHARGKAVDINPLYNPYLWTDQEGNRRCDPVEGQEYMDRTKDFPYKIGDDDLCRRLFEEHGFIWGGTWNYDKDYMHFSYRFKG